VIPYIHERLCKAFHVITRVHSVFFLRAFGWIAVLSCLYPHLQIAKVARQVEGTCFRNGKYVTSTIITLYCI